MRMRKLITRLALLLLYQNRKMALDLLNISVFEKYGYTIFHGLEKLVEQGCIYQHQAEAVKAIKKELENQPAGFEGFQKVSLAVLPTGAGKTGVGVLAAYACGAHRVLIITPSEAISMQQLTQFKPVDIDMPEGETSRMNPLKNEPFLRSRKIIPHMLAGTVCPGNAVCALSKDALKSAKANPCDLVITNVHKFGKKDGNRGFPVEKYPRNYFSLVIVDEAHHFPAPTWKSIVDHFQEAEVGILFLTATPQRRDKYILSFPIEKPTCYKYPFQQAVNDGIIRDTTFIPVGNKSDSRNKQILMVLNEAKEQLAIHDRQDRKNSHKAIVLAKGIFDATAIANAWNEQVHVVEDGKESCKTFVQGDDWEDVNSFITKDHIKVLVVIYRLTEGFDCKRVSVAAILRNVGKASRAYFAQFIGRAVRKLDSDDPVTATVISHVNHKQQQNYDAFINAELPNEGPEELANHEEPEPRSGQ